MLEKLINLITLHPFIAIEGMLVFFILCLVSLLIFKKQTSLKIDAISSVTPVSEPIIKVPNVITSHDIRAVAGDDIMTTQLDLARAYIELGKKNLANKILIHVEQHGNRDQQIVAKRLMMSL
jgi:FimV-like protein